MKFKLCGLCYYRETPEKFARIYFSIFLHTMYYVTYERRDDNLFNVTFLYFGTGKKKINLGTREKPSS